MNDRDLLTEYGATLTPKELEVFLLVARGMSQRQISLALNLHRSTVRSRIESGTKRLRDAVAREVVDTR